MPIFLLKSILSLFMLLLVFIAMFTMFEVFGRSDKKYSIEKLKKIHRTNGIIYILLFFVIAYFCFDFIFKTKAEPSARAAFHGVFAITVIVLLFFKISFVEIYRQFYGKVQTIGLFVAFISFLMIGTSAGYFLLITKFGTDRSSGKIGDQKKEVIMEKEKIAVRTGAENIKKGKELYESKCYFCHDAYSRDTIVGPSHKGILKNPLLPISRKPATPENIANQIRNPYKDMPSFSYLSDEQVQDIIAFLNTL
ncbi:MAG: cytochrome c [Nitrospirota bacterium]